MEGFMVRKFFIAVFILFIAGQTLAQTAPKTTDEQVINHIKGLERYTSNDSAYNHYAMTQSYIALPDYLKTLVKYLFDKNYTAINKAIDEAQAQHRNDLSDYQLDRNIDMATMVLTDDKYISQSTADEWAKATPDHFFAHFIKASVYLNLGFAARGTKSANETPEDNFNRMRAFNDLAYASVKKSIELNPDFEFSYATLIHFLQASSGKDNEAADAYKKGLAVNPYSFIVRWMYLDYNLPQWHGDGDTKKMQAIIDALGKEKNKNKGLESIKGRVLCLAGSHMKYRWTKTLVDEDFAKAIELFDAALSYGDLYIYHYEKSMALFSFHNYEDAFIHIEKAVAISPYNESAHYKYAWIKDSLPARQEKIFPYR